MFMGKKTKKAFALALALVMAAPSVSVWMPPVAVEAAETTALEQVRARAASVYTSSQKAFDLDLSDQTFSGGVLDYSADTEKYLTVFNNLRTSTDDQTVIIRFKTESANGLLFGAGTDNATNEGQNMTLALKGGQLRTVIRNAKSGGLKGVFSGGLADGKWHTVAMSFVPSLGNATDNIRLVIDGGDELYASTGWGNSWIGGFNQKSTEVYTTFQVGGGKYVNDDSATAAFTGEIDFITIINEAFTADELKTITEGDKDARDSFSVMTASGTCNTWLFTGGTETVADFSKIGTTRNYVGLFEDNLRSGGTYVERGRFVFNTAKRGMDIEKLLENYDTMIAAYGTKAVGIMVGAADYEKGAAGVAAFQANLEALLGKIYDADKIPFLITPYPSKDADKQQQISAYIDAMEEAAGKRTRIVDISGLNTSFLAEDGSLTSAGHQAVANTVKNELGISGTTSFGFALTEGNYTVAKKTDNGLEAEVKEVIAGAGYAQVSVEETTISGSTAKLSYTLTDEAGQVISGSAAEGQTSFTIDGLKTGASYTLQVYDESRGNVKEAYRPVDVKVLYGEAGVSREHADGNEAVNETISALLTSEEPVTYLFMGDSITHGIVTQGYDNVPQMFAKYLDELGRTDDVVLNTGVSNATLSTTLDQIEPRLERYEPDVVMIMLGTNDSSTRGEMVNGDTNNLQGFKDRYKDLVRKIHANKADTSIVLRVPCEMLVDDAHSQYESYFASIYEVADEMRAEIDGLNIVVVDHMQEWRDYSNSVRNDNIAKTGTYAWLVDNVHPNGRGNLSMFQQIIRELGLYVNTSELANYAYTLDAWTASSTIAAPVSQKGTQAEFSMSALSDYTNSLRQVTVTLTDETGRTISKTADYAADGTILLQNLESQRTYTATVTGTDAVNSKEVSFAASLNKMTVAPESMTLTAADGKTTLTKEGETLQLIPEIAPAGADVPGITYTSSDEKVAAVSADGVVTAVANGKAVIKATVTGTQIEMTVEIKVEIPEDEEVKAARESLTSLITDAKKVDLTGYTADSAAAFTKALEEAEKATAKEKVTKEELQALLKALQEAKAGLKRAEDDVKEVPAVGTVFEVGVLQYKVTKSDAANGTVAVTKLLKNKSKVIIPATVEKDGYTFKVTAVNKKVFQNNKKLKSVTIGSNVTKIGAKAFLKCAKLKNVIFKGTKAPKIGKQAFKGIKANAKITVPKKIAAKQLKTLKKRMKSAGRKVVFKKK